jgi:release factor glutamine methyltransferase
MTVLEWLQTSMIKLRDTGVDSPRRDCMVLIEDLLGKDRAWVNAHGEYKLADEQTTILNKQIKKRLNRIPLAYIRGKAWFYKRFFHVDPRVLIPRPESESFITILKDLDLENSIIADVGTGSGCLGITAALEIPGAAVHLYDIDPAALKVACQNARRHEIKAEFYQSDLLGDLRAAQYDVLAANLPYVPEGLVTSPEIEAEPKLALFSGKDGLDQYRRFWQQIESLDQKPKYILTESLQNQHSELEKLATQAGYDPNGTDLLVQSFKLS